MNLDLNTFKREVGNWKKVATIHEFHVSEIMEVIDRAITAEKALELLADKIVWGWREQCPDWSPACGGKMLWCDGETAINCIVKRALEKAREAQE